MRYETNLHSIHLDTLFKWWGLEEKNQTLLWGCNENGRNWCEMTPDNNDDIWQLLLSIYFISNNKVSSDISILTTAQFLQTAPEHLCPRRLNTMCFTASFWFGSADNSSGDTGILRWGERHIKRGLVLKLLKMSYHWSFKIYTRNI